MNLDIDSRYTAVHVRRGDYLKVATHIVDDATYIAFLRRVDAILPSPINFFCDSPLRQEFRNEVVEVLKGKEVSFHDDKTEDECLVHDVMRLSKLLVTSNSTFSFTAGLLASADCLVFSPMKFYGANMGTIRGNPSGMPVISSYVSRQCIGIHDQRSILLKCACSCRT